MAARAALGFALLLGACNDDVLVTVRVRGGLNDEYGYASVTLTDLDGTTRRVDVGVAAVVQEGGTASINDSSSTSPSNHISMGVSVAGLRFGDVIWFFGNDSSASDGEEVPSDCTCVAIADPVYDGSAHWTQVDTAIPTIRFISVRQSSNGGLGGSCFAELIDGETTNFSSLKVCAAAPTELFVKILSCTHHSYDDLRGTAALMRPAC